LAPIFFQPLVWELAAFGRPPGEPVNPRLESGGVVGGVIGSFEVGDDVLALSSVKPARSAGSLDDEVELLGSLDQGMLSKGNNPILGDRLDSSELDD
jgi:hypothetical protein